MGYFSSVPNENIWIDKVLKWIIDIIVVVILAILVTMFFGKDVRVEGRSMSPGIETGETVLLNRLHYVFFSPDRYDVIAFKTKSGETIVKRIIGMPGEKVKILDGCVYINGEKIDYYDGQDLIVNAGEIKEETTIGANEYFVLGDNLNNSEDSRFKLVGMVNKTDIIGKVWLRVAPIKRIGMVK